MLFRGGQGRRSIDTRESGSSLFVLVAFCFVLGCALHLLTGR